MVRIKKKNPEFRKESLSPRAWKYSNSDEINNGNRDNLYDNAFLGESVEWLKELTKPKEE